MSPQSWTPVGAEFWELRDGDRGPDLQFVDTFLAGTLAGTLALVEPSIHFCVMN